MTTAGALWSFALVVGLLTLTPGLDTALIVRAAVVRRPRYAWGVVMGIQTGTLLWGVLTALGITAILTASAVAYEVLRWAGVVYLGWIGLRMLWASRRGAESDPAAVAVGGPAAAEGCVAGWRRGVATNLLNPKMGAFYVSLLPQFIPVGTSPLLFGVLLASVHIALGLAWSTVLVLSARRFQRVLQRPVARRTMDRVAGTVIIGFGVKLATTTR